MLIVTADSPWPNNTAFRELYQRVHRHLDDTNDSPSLYGPVNLNGDWTLSRVGNDLYNGLSGVLLAHSALYDALQDEAVKQHAQCLYDYLCHHVDTVPGIGMSGVPGVLYALLCSGRYLNQPQRAMRTLVCKHLNALSIDDKSEIDFLNGASGLLTLLLQLQQQAWYEPKPSLLQSIGQLLDKRIFENQDADDKPLLCGLAHGYSGFALGYGALYRLTGDAQYRANALACVRKEDALWDETHQHWPDLRAVATCYHYYWCAGSAGIYLARRLLAQWLEQPIDHVETAYQMTYRFIPRCPNISLCHGLGGLLEVCLQSDSPQDRIMIECYRNKLLRDGREAPLYVESPGLMLGAAGQLYQSLRCTNPRRYPAVLLMALPESLGAEG